MNVNIYKWYIDDMISVSNEYFRLIILYNKWEIGTEVKKDDEQNAYIRLYKMNLLSKCLQ